MSGGIFAFNDTSGCIKQSEYEKYVILLGNMVKATSLNKERRNPIYLSGYHFQLLRGYSSKTLWFTFIISVVTVVPSAASELIT